MQPAKTLTWHVSPLGNALLDCLDLRFKSQSSLLNWGLGRLKKHFKNPVMAPEKPEQSIRGNVHAKQWKSCISLSAKYFSERMVKKNPRKVRGTLKSLKRNPNRRMGNSHMPSLMACIFSLHFQSCWSNHAIIMINNSEDSDLIMLSVDKSISITPTSVIQEHYKSLSYCERQEESYQVESLNELKLHIENSMKFMFQLRKVCHWNSKFFKSHHLVVIIADTWEFTDSNFKEVDFHEIYSLSSAWFAQESPIIWDLSSLLTGFEEICSKTSSSIFRKTEDLIYQTWNLLEKVMKFSYSRDYAEQHQIGFKELKSLVSLTKEGRTN